MHVVSTGRNVIHHVSWEGLSVLLGMVEERPFISHPSFCRWSMAVPEGLISRSGSSWSTRFQGIAVANTLKEIIGRAEQQFKGDVRGLGVEARRGVEAVISDAKNGVINAGRSVVINGVRTGVNEAIGAAAQAMTGDVGGAVERLISLPGTIANASTYGLTHGSILTSGSIDGLNFGSRGSPNSVYAELAGRSDPLLSFNWYCNLPPIAVDGKQARLDWNYVEEATVPFRNYETRSVFRAGRMRHYAKSYSIDNLRLAFYLDTAGRTMEYLQMWDNAMVRKTTKQDMYREGGQFGLPTNYKKDIKIHLVDPNRQELVELLYVECWPTNLDALNLNSGASDRLIANVNFSVGDVFVNSLGVSRTTIDGILRSPNPSGNIGSIFQDAANQVISRGVQAVTSGVSGAIGRASGSWF